MSSVSFPTVDFKAGDLRSITTLFPDSIDRDAWVFYHATSSLAEDAIDSMGLAWTPAICSFEEVETLVRIFRSMNWSGLHTGGYVVLASFTLQGDFQGKKAKPIYFREYSCRSLIYAKRDLAGGESASAVRLAMRDLEGYHRNQAVRQEHYEHQRQACIQEVRSGYLPTPVMRVSLEWLGRQIEALGELWARCEEICTRHTHGVVYAVRFTPDDLPFLDYSDPMGLRCYRPLPVERIVGKARILAPDFDPPAGNGYEEFEANLWRHETEGSLLYALREYKNARRSCETVSDGGCWPYSPPEFLDASAGVDESALLALQFGTSEVQEYIRRSGKDR